jgi:phosphoribosylamine---glycine ligase
MKILVIGNGGREHAIAWKIAQNDKVEKIYCAPGNGGTVLENKCVNVELTSTMDLIEFAQNEKIDLTFVGPEINLALGIVDEFKSAGLVIFGPSGYAAQLEGSKAFAKDFMKMYGVKTAAYETFEDKDTAIEYLKNCDYPIVIKADGLAGGKGVSICENSETAEMTIIDFMIADIFKGSGKKIVIEEYLEGIEASILSITDGQTIIPFLSAKDHKQIYDNDKGPNTGGMGVIAPNPYCTDEILDVFNKEIMMPTLEGIKAEVMDYTGIIFFGIMITQKGVYNLEYNVRMGDPETQAVLSLMESDFLELIQDALDQKLSTSSVKWNKGNACCVVAVSKGYPGEYRTNLEITGVDKIISKTFIAGGKYENKSLRTSGGRVLSIVALGKSLEEAREKAYLDMEKIQFEGIYFRNDIGKV